MGSWKLFSFVTDDGGRHDRSGRSGNGVDIGEVLLKAVIPDADGVLPHGVTAVPSERVAP